ncbi:MAG: SGNH/GDSL hydrolase family protein [Alphaproteobacteria bacterium]
MVFAAVALFLGLAVAVALGELSGRGIAEYYLFTRSREIQKSFRDAESLKILCLGDSHTAGAEAPKGSSYPDYLLRLLDERCDIGPVEIINFGFAGSDMTEMRQRMEKFLPTLAHQPDFMIIQGGVNDVANWLNLRAYIEQNGIETPWWFLPSSQSLVMRFAETETSREFFESPAYLAYVGKQVDREYTRLVALCREMGIQPVLLNYAAYGWHPIFPVVAAAAERLQTPCIRFRQPDTVDMMVERGWQAPGGHPNAGGYQFVAQVVLVGLQRLFPDRFTCRTDSLPALYLNE